MYLYNINRYNINIPIVYIDSIIDLFENRIINILL